MTVAEYASRHGLTEKAVYHAVYAGRIPFVRRGGKLDLEDVPLAVHPRFRRPEELTELPDYILALIWLNGTISGDSILVRHKDYAIPETVASAIRSSVWQRDGNRTQRVCKICSPAICAAIRDLGFSGRKDLDRLPPPVDEIALAKAFFESHSSFGFALHYARNAPGDKSRAYYSPRVTLCAAPGITDTLALALTSLDIAPLKRTAAAANGKSAVYIITSRGQLETASRVLSPDLDGYGLPGFWERFDAHAAAKAVPYAEYHKNE